MSDPQPGWRAFWDGRHKIYVNDRHRQAHYEKVAADIVSVLPGVGAVVLDHGCGEALFADRVALRCARLYLCDAAPSVRERLADRFADDPAISVIAPEAVADIPNASLDLIVANSLLQYLTQAEFDALAEIWRRKLVAGGALILADIVPPQESAAAAARALLAAGFNHGFLIAALFGLAATFFSDYRRLRQQLGLTRYAEGEMIARLARAGFKAERRRPNFGFNRRRMTFIARPASIAGEP